MVKPSEYLDEFKEYISKSRSSNTVKAYMYDLKNFLELYQEDISNLSESHIERYKATLFSALNLEAKTINRRLVSIKRFIEFINKTESNININIDIKLIKIQQYPYLEDPLKYSEFERLTRAAEKENDKRALAIFYCLYLTGVRVSEMLTLNVSDIEKNEVEIKGKGEKHRKISIRPKLKEYLKDYTRDRKHKEDQKLFINKTKDTPMSRTTVHYIIKYYAGKSKIKKSKAHAHNFRHLFAVQLVNSKVPIDEIQMLLGHTNINTTTIYTKKPTHEVFSQIDKL